MYRLLENMCQLEFFAFKDKKNLIFDKFGYLTSKIQQTCPETENRVIYRLVLTL